jgi:hypothetical protein
MKLTRISSEDITLMETAMQPQKNNEALATLIIITCLISFATVAHYWINQDLYNRKILRA